MAMFVLVVDTSLMNVSIAAVVEDLDTTVSGVQSAIALEALVSAAFILIGAKVGDLLGRKRAYVLGLLGYAVGAVAMALSQSLTAIIIFWAVVGGLGASLLLPSMQSLIHGNFEGAAQRKVYAMVGAAAAIAAAVGPLLGGFITTYLSWRVAFLLEALVIAVVLSGIKLVRDVPYTGAPGIDLVGAALSALGMGGIVLGILVWQEGGEAVGALILIGVAAMAALVWWLRRRKREGKPALLDADLFKSKVFRFGITGQMFQQIALGGTMIVLPIYLQIVLEYNAMEAGLSLAPLSLSMFAVALIAGRKAGDRRSSTIIRAGFALVTVGLVVIVPIVPHVDTGWYLVLPLIVVGCGLGLLVSQLNNYTLAPISEERVSEAAGVNSAAGSFGLSFGLAFAGAIMLAALSFSFTEMTESSKVLPPAEQATVAQVLEDDAQVVSDTQLVALLEDQPEEIREENPPHQHRCAGHRPPGRAGHPDPRRAPRTGELVPHGAHTGTDAVGVRRGDGAGLTSGAEDSPTGTTRRPVERDQLHRTELLLLVSGIVVLGVTALSVRDAYVSGAERSVFRWINGLPDAIYTPVAVIMQLGNLAAVLVLTVVAGRAPAVPTRDRDRPGGVGRLRHLEGRQGARRPRPPGRPPRRRRAARRARQRARLRVRALGRPFAVVTVAVLWLAPKARTVLWLVAATVAFSRIYVGATSPWMSSGAPPSAPPVAPWAVSSSGLGATGTNGSEHPDRRRSEIDPLIRRAARCRSAARSSSATASGRAWHSRNRRLSSRSPSSSGRAMPSTRACFAATTAWRGWAAIRSAHSSAASTNPSSGSRPGRVRSARPRRCR